MSNYLGDFASNATVYFDFSLNDGSGGRVDASSAFETADIRVYKNGGATQRASESGYVVNSVFDSMVGAVSGSIDLSDNTDAGFYETGADYSIWLYPDETVDSQSVVACVGQFSIQNRFMRGTNSANTTTPPTVTEIREEIDANSTQLDEIVEDTRTTIPNQIDALHDFDYLTQQVDVGAINGESAVNGDDILTFLKKIFGPIAGECTTDTSDSAQTVHTYRIGSSTISVHTVKTDGTRTVA